MKDKVTKTLYQSYQTAEKIMKNRATSFYHAFSSLPKERFFSVAALYAFNRYADDLVDFGNKEANQKEILDKLDELEVSIGLLNDKTNTVTTTVNELPWWEAFVHTYRKYHFSSEAFIMQINGQRMDISVLDIVTLDDLITYCKLVAGSVGFMLLPILVDDESYLNNNDFVNAALDLGIAMQITNILRDIGEDIRLRKRIYIPLALLKEYQVTKEDLFALSITTEEVVVHDNIIALWEYLASISNQYYQNYEKYISYFMKEARLPLMAAAEVYKAIMDAVRVNQYNCFTKRCYTTKTVRNQIIKQVKQKLGNI